MDYTLYNPSFTTKVMNEQPNRDDRLGCRGLEITAYIKESCHLAYMNCPLDW